MVTSVIGEPVERPDVEAWLEALDVLNNHAGTRLRDIPVIFSSNFWEKGEDAVRNGKIWEKLFFISKY